METFAEGLATRVPFELPQQILWEHLDDFVLVSDDEIREATRLMIEHTRNLVEAAGAAPLAAALKLARPACTAGGRARRERRQHQSRAARGALRLEKRPRWGPLFPHALERT